MSTPASKSRLWSAKLTRLAAAQQAAQEAVLIAIHEAREDGVTLQVVADSVGGVSPSGVTEKARRGAAILAKRKGKRQS